ncbi:hypothetical protein AAFF_G00057790 [Aldrovandia affinis]|uniref:Uncharacterized protein n=1 Tax=Aldrovandia affinis TaxID=143900 RepID=A0AAD7S2T9_9TELE|nr:hypothetical protein AAFF_G00057790 [Aldrovandia affinis]
MLIAETAKMEPWIPSSFCPPASSSRWGSASLRIMSSRARFTLSSPSRVIANVWCVVSASRGPPPRAPETALSQTDGAEEKEKEKRETRNPSEASNGSSPQTIE